MENLRCLIKNGPSPFTVGKTEWQFFVTGISALRRMVEGTANEFLLRDALAGRERVKEIFAKGTVVKLGQRIDIESWYNQAKEFRRELFDNLDYALTHHFSDVQALLIEADQLRALIDIVHEDAPIVLGFLKDLRLTAGDVAGLRECLPFKHALTAVLKVMGSPSPGGFKTVVEETQGQGTFDKLLSLITWIAQDFFRLAPQEVYAVLEIIAQRENYSRWNKDQWDEFKGQIEGYYKSGLPTPTHDLFKCFLEHQQDPSFIEKLKIDMEHQLKGALVWGGAWDMEGSIKDELILMARHMPVRDRTLMDYSGMALRLKHVLWERKDHWTQEVDEGLRQLYRVSFLGTPTIYDGASDKALNRGRLNQTLSLLAREDGERSSIAEVFDRILKKQELRVLDQRVLVDMVLQSSGMQRDDYVAIPREDRSNLEWLSRWAVLLGGSWQKVVKRKDVLIGAGETIEMILPEDFNREIHTIRLLKKLKDVFSNILDEIRKELANYKTSKRLGSRNLYIGFFDDFFHLMGCMGTGVCNWDFTDQLVSDRRYHFGAIVLKDDKGRLLAKAQVQLLKAGISNFSEKRSPKGWQVLAVVTNNLLEKDFGVDTFEAYRAMLLAAQILAEKNGLQGAVLVEDPEIHAQEDLERGYVKALVEQGWLVKRDLSEDIVFFLNYRRVYLLQIPSEKYWLEPLERNLGFSK